MGTIQGTTDDPGIPHRRGGEPLQEYRWYPENNVFPTGVGVNRLTTTGDAGRLCVFPTGVGVNRMAFACGCGPFQYSPQAWG